MKIFWRLYKDIKQERSVSLKHFSSFKNHHTQHGGTLVSFKYWPVLALFPDYLAPKIAQLIDLKFCCFVNAVFQSKISLEMQVIQNNKSKVGSACICDYTGRSRNVIKAKEKQMPKNRSQNFSHLWSFSQNDTVC